MSLWFKTIWNLFWLVLKPIVFLKIKPIHLGNLNDVKAPVIFASNHLSIYDPWVIGSVLPFNSKFFPIRFLAKEAFFTYKFLWLGYFLRFFFGAIPVKKKIGLDKALGEALLLLKKGYSLGIFPSGKISNNFEKKYRGIGYLHQQSKIPIIPVAISDKFSFFNLLRKNFEIKVIFGQPIYCPEKEIDEIVDIVVEEIIDLKKAI
jgi:1-acyl-sn-glycerol-3-phosphate acyltransferase